MTTANPIYVSIPNPADTLYRSNQPNTRILSASIELEPHLCMFHAPPRCRRSRKHPLVSGQLYHCILSPSRSLR